MHVRVLPFPTRRPTQLSVLVPIFLELLFVLILDGFELSHLFQAVWGLLLVYSMDRAVAVIRISTREVRETFVSNMNYLLRHLRDFANVFNVCGDERPPWRTW